jgi:hypothetical protein
MDSGSPSSSQGHEREKYSALVMVAGLACLTLALVSRSPDLLLRARFFAEDGQTFYQQAHELGFARSIFLPYAGYLHLFPRLIAGLSLWLPLFYVPLFFDIVALTIQGITAVYICSPRMRKTGPLRLRVVVAFLYLGLPHIGEVWGRLTNSQWHMAVLSFLILIAAAPQSRMGTWFDRVALALGALTGPFSILLLPIALVAAIFRRSSRTVINLAIVGLGALVQAITMLIHGRPEAGELGASFPLLFHLLVRWLFLTVLPHPWHVGPVLWDVGYFLFVVAVAVLVWIVWKGSFEVRCTLLLGAIVAAASLASPIIVNRGEQWPVMLSGAGERYWFIPRVAIALAGLWVAAQPFSKWARAAGVLAMAALVLFCVKGWHIAQWPGTHFRTYVHVYNGLPIGSALRIPIDPPPSWSMQITRKPSDWIYEDAEFIDGEILPIGDWRSRQQVAGADESSAPAPGGVVSVNGIPFHGAGTAMTPVHISVHAGALLEGWAVLPGATDIKTMDEMYAIVSDRVVQGDQLPFAGQYQNIEVDNAMYLIFLPPTVLHAGLQEVTIMGHSQGDNTLRMCGQPLYLYGD